MNEIIQNLDARSTESRNDIAESSVIQLNMQDRKYVINNWSGIAQYFDLSCRQTEIAAAICESRSIDQIAAEPYISRNAVIQHRDVVYDKLDAADTAELVCRCIWADLYCFGLPPIDRKLSAKDSEFAKDDPKYTKSRIIF